MWDRVPLYNIESEAGCKLMAFLWQRYESWGCMFAVVFGLSSFYRKCLLLSLCHAHISLLMSSHMALPHFSFSFIACSSDSTVPNDLSFSCFLFPLFHKVCCQSLSSGIFHLSPSPARVLGGLFFVFPLLFVTLFLQHLPMLSVHLCGVILNSLLLFQEIHSSFSF